MKQKRLNVRCLAFLAFFAICSFGFAQVPTGFPNMPNTGNPGQDAETYEQLKQVWIQNNPSQPITAGQTVVTTPTEAQNAAYEAAKVQAAAAANAVPADLAEHQLRALETTFNLHQAEWSIADVRTRDAYIAAFTMARGQTIVTISAQQYASFPQELKNLVDANTSLFTVTQ
jgi:hypothetical protein